MKEQNEKKKGQPLYLQLYVQLKQDIVDGVRPMGSKLPSKRTLAEKHGISVIPVEHALTLLCDEGYVESRERSGYFVIYRRDDFFSAPEKEAPERDPEPVRMPTERQTERYAFPFSVLARKMRKVMLDHGDGLLVKSPNRGCPELRAAIAAYLRRSGGIVCDPEQIVIGSGAEYLYSMIVQLLGAERTFAVEDPCYAQIERVYAANGVRTEKLAIGRNGIRSEALNRSSATVLHVTPFHSYPSGVTADASKRREYLAWAAARHGFVIEDNYDSELTVSRKNEDTLFATAQGRNVLYLNTFSQTVAPSIRVGYLVLPPALVEEFDRKLGFYSCTVPVFEQYLLTELLVSGDFERHINRVRRRKRSAAK